MTPKSVPDWGAVDADSYAVTFGRARLTATPEPDADPATLPPDRIEGRLAREGDAAKADPDYRPVTPQETATLAAGEPPEPVPEPSGFGAPRAARKRLRDPQPDRMTDLGNAELLVTRHGRDLHYAPERGWYVWDGCRWRPDDLLELDRRASETVRSIYKKAGKAGTVEDRKALANWAKKSEARARIDAMIELAKAMLPMPIRITDFDRDDYLLNVANGTLNLRTGTLQAHSREDLITKLAPAAYDGQATAPRWDQFLEEVLPDAEERGYVQRRVGYSLTGVTDEQDLAVLYGGGQNGKSTFIEMIHAVLGDYATQGDAELLLERRDHGIPNDVARLHGARFVAVVESGEGRRLDEPLVKRLTGGDTVTARFLHHEFFEFRPKAKLWLATNHKPSIRGTDDAIWRRVRVIPFTVKISEVDKKLGEKLRAEAPGILAWAVAGCLEWQRDGLGLPKAIVGATGEYRAAEDVIGLFLEDRCDIGSELRVAAADLRLLYQGWCDANGERLLSQKDLGARLTERGFTRERYGHEKHWRWVGLKPLSADPSPAPKVPGTPSVTPSDGSGTGRGPIEESADPNSGVVALDRNLHEGTQESGSARVRTGPQGSADDGGYPRSATDPDAPPARTGPILGGAA